MRIDSFPSISYNYADDVTQPEQTERNSMQSHVDILIFMWYSLIFHFLLFVIPFFSVIFARCACVCCWCTLSVNIFLGMGTIEKLTSIANLSIIIILSYSHFPSYSTLDFFGSKTILSMRLQFLTYVNWHFSLQTALHVCVCLIF